MGIIFLSYSRSDMEEVNRLSNKLVEAGHEVWIDRENIPGGEQWRCEIVRGIKRADNFLLILSRKATESDSVRKELSLADKAKTRIIPVEIEPVTIPDAMEYQLVDIQRINLHTDFDAGFQRLLNALGSVPPARLPELQPFEPEMILIPAGEFLMGSDPTKDKYADEREQPQHRLHLPDYHIAKTPITNAQYLAFVEATSYDNPDHWKKGKPPKGRKDHPVVWVDWHDAMAYCTWLAEATGRAYRLSSEAEWEKAARGTDGRIYPWGSEWDEKCCNSEEGGLGNTTPVGHYSPGGDSPYGCVDMVGNVWEWTHSLYKGYPYDPEDGREGVSVEGRRTLRGGSWYGSQRNVRVSYRHGTHPGIFNLDIGFRVIAAPVSGS